MDPDFAYRHSRQGVTVNRTIDTILCDDEQSRTFFKLREELKWLQLKYQIITEMFEDIMDSEDVRNVILRAILPMVLRFYREDDENLADELVEDLCLFYDKELQVHDSECKALAIQNLLDELSNKGIPEENGPDELF